MKKKILFLLLFYYCLSLGQRYTSTWYTTDNGLPQNSIKAITKDKHGFIWLNTENGIVRYDGVNFLTYQNFPTSSQRFKFFYGNIDNDSIFSNEAFEGTVLVNQRDAQIYKSKKKLRNNVISYNKNHYMLYCSNSYISTIYSKIGYYIKLQEGIYYIKDNSISFKRNKSKKGSKINIPINTLFELFTIDNTLFHLNFKSRTVQEIRNGKVTATYENKLLTDKKSKIFWNQINNQIFIYDKNTVYNCFRKNGKFQIVKLADITRNADCFCIFYDKSCDKLYLGNSVKGLQVIKFSDFKVAKKKTLAVYYATLPYDSSKVITPFGEVYNHNGLIENKHFSSFSDYFIGYDHEKNILIENEDENFKLYKIKNNYKTNQPIYFPDKRLIRGFFYNKGKYFVASRAVHPSTNLGFIGFVTVYRAGLSDVEKEFKFNDEVRKIFKIDDNNILVGTIKGLYKISLITNKTYWLSKNNENINVLNIIRTNDGEFWITTSGKGFYLLKNNKLIKMPYDINKNLSTPHTILEDRKGFFWISTNNGLYRVHESELLKYSTDKSKKVNYYRFTKNDGFNTDEFNGGGNVCGTRLNNGEFVFPSLDGLIFFDPLKVKSYYPRQVYIERVVINDEIKNFKNNLDLEQNITRATFFIDIPYYANSSNVVILAKINDSPYSKWEVVGKDRKYTISNLSHGKYTLTIKVLASDDGKFIYKKIDIKVPLYFYQTIWFNALLCFIFLILLYLLIRWRINFLKQKNSELEKIIKQRTKSLSDSILSLENLKIELHKENQLQKKLIGTITHDITSPIRFIALSTEEILRRKGNDLETVMMFLGSINKSSNQLYNFAKTLKEYADIYNEEKTSEILEYNLYDFVQEKKVLFDEIAKNKNTEIFNNIDKKSTILISKNILSAIIHNLLDNSVKFTEDGIIVLENKWEGDNLILNIRDSGIGMDSKKIEYYTNIQKNPEDKKLILQKYGMGLHFIIQLLQMISSSIVIENLSQGTSFELILKNKKK